jgi:hypothetical protein
MDWPTNLTRSTHPTQAHRKEAQMKLTLLCMECSDEVEIGEVADDFTQEWPEWMLHNLICNPCLKSKFDIDMDEIDQLINNDMENES